MHVCLVFVGFEEEEGEGKTTFCGRCTRRKPPHYNNNTAHRKIMLSE
jgi:hypothetical protein